MAEIIRGMPEEEYFSLKLLSASLLRTARMNGMAAARQSLMGQQPESEAMRLGWLCHLRVNQPDQWAARVAREPEELAKGIRTKTGKDSVKPKATDEYRQRFRDWVSSQDGRICLSDETYDQVQRIAQTLLDSACYTQCDSHEVVILFDFNGTPAKCRIDGELFDRDYGAWHVYDWKFMESTRNFNWQIMKYGYHLQAAFYLEACKAVGRDNTRFHLVGINKTTCDGNDIVCAPCGQGLVELGLLECLHYHDRIKQCQLTDYWPGADSPVEWDVPRGYFFQPEVGEAAWTP